MGRGDRSERHLQVAVTRPGGPVAAAISRALTARGAISGAGTVTVHAITDHLASPTLGEQLDGIHHVVHVVSPTMLDHDLAEAADARRDRLVREVRTLVLACAATRVHSLVVVTGAQVYGARPTNPVPLPKDSPLQAEIGPGLIGDLVAVEQAVADARPLYPALDITVVRPAAIVGDGVDTTFTRHFAAPRLLRLGDSDPAWQFVHVEDLATAVCRILDHRLGPVVTVGAPGWLRQAKVEQLTGMSSVQMGVSTAHTVVSRLQRFGRLKAPVTDLDYIAHPWVVSADELHAAGWQPAYDNEMCLQVLLHDVRERTAASVLRIDAKEGAAALGAASAALAVGATAAIMRRRRGRRG
ncbi:NAD-dependent epimerase/dehydratase family protein [Rudaeicoccus suwonensis]|uniref:Nucleoside-diphosphate-sugar epimerase n=1 Tax=Rudaeicoccus suwonensis TaxID=657409 RepID=A0A561E191_9MICO|nr:NAD-dependent epimerase/dehydratase family protein [Rudaeicoccus suwonensis]TWE09398.1 nucleoside-diphosphate-sugar epimerase [Rudaeicoccus suwonensis]